LLGGLLLALFSNAVNLFDVRPGRAGKVAFVVYLVALAAVPRSALPYLPLLLAAALFFRSDCRGSLIMGDVGAYPLGFAIGLSLLQLSLPVKGALCCLLAAFHVYCEVRSVTVSIERNSILNWVDNLWVRE
jgi:UDP-N-acetylmuramyl pentapeptide phosphotransferase/UDP-N-acetylglucosamine-1-phosphate transferase